MSLPSNDKKGKNTTGKNQKGKAAGSSKFIQGGSSSKPLTVAKKVRSTGANRGS